MLDVLVDGLSVGAVDTYSFNAVEENQTIEAVFGTLSKEVSLNVVGDGGNLMPDGDTAVTCGDDLSVAIIPAPCHIIESIQVNGLGVTVRPINSMAGSAELSGHSFSESGGDSGNQDYHISI